MDDLKTERERAGLTIEQLALLSGVTARVIRAVEDGVDELLDSERIAIEEVLSWREHA